MSAEEYGPVVMPCNWCGRATFDLSLHVPVCPRRPALAADEPAPANVG